MTEGKREVLLGRIREALRVPTQSHATRSSGKHSAPVDGDQTARDCLPSVPSDYAGRLALFRERSIQLKTDFHIAASPEAVLATPDQLLADLPEAFELLRLKYRDRYPSFAGLITGPSRTGDIERILVLGAHGPRNLTIILVDRR
jgi:hypothetical protein